MTKNERLLRVKIKIAGKRVPSYHSELAAGCDLCADIAKPIKLKAGAFCRVGTGIAVEIPAGYEAQVRPRSGLAYNNGIGILNAPGTIDADYRGEIMIVIFNFGSRDFMIKPGDRIAQLVFNRVVRAQFVRTDRLSTTGRGQGGFGHTGIRNKSNQKGAKPGFKK